MTVPIIDDNIFENVETFTATLTTSDEHVSIGADSMATVFITDNDSKINLLHTYIHQVCIKCIPFMRSSIQCAVVTSTTLSSHV